VTTRRAFPLLLFILILSNTACSTILKKELMQAEIGNTGWITFKEGYKFQEAHVSIVLHSIPLTDSQFIGSRCLMMGPPLFPIFPYFRHWSNQPRKIGFSIEINNADGSAVLDLYKLQIELSDGRLIRPVAVYTDEKDGAGYDIQVDRAKMFYRGRLLNPGNVTLSRENINYKLQFDEFPTDIEGITVNFGSVQIDGKEFLLPPLRYRKSTKYQYYWINDV
jgi:hypothetical protein